MKKKQAGDHPEIETSLFKVGSSTYRIAPVNGFRLMQWNIQTIKGVREILFWPDHSNEVPFAKIRGGNPILFPFAGRSYDRGVEQAWHSPAGKRLPMPQHGFARQGRFEVSQKSDNSITGELIPDEEAIECYPFEYVFSVRYQFEDLSFQVILQLENRGADPIPWSAGHHFYFNLPWHENLTRSDYRLKMDTRKCAYHGPDGKLVMERDREICHELSDTSLVDRIHWELRHNRVSFGPKSGEEDIHLIIGQETVPQKNYSVVTWSESADAPFYCIEPWMGPPNAAGHGKGLHWVNPGESQAFAVEVSLY